jgi:two-component system cell cycle sensor histidine kinase/response regulator CckA
LNFVESVEKLYLQAVSGPCALWIGATAGLTCFFAIACVLLVKEKKKNRVTAYYLDVVRIISKSISNNHEIVAFNSNDDVIYTTHPEHYVTKREFTKFISCRVTSTDDLTVFLKMLDSRKSYGSILSGSGTGLRNHFKKWLVNCSFVAKEESLIEDDVSVVTISDVSKYFDEVEKVVRNCDRLENFLDNCPIGMFYLNNNNIIIGANSTFADMVKVNRENVIGIAIREFIERFEDRAEGAQYMRSIVKVRPKYSVDFDAILIRSQASSISSMRPWIMIQLDRSERCDSKDEFARQEAFIFASVPSIITTAVGEIRAANPAFASMAQDAVFLAKEGGMRPNLNILDIAEGTGIAQCLERAVGPEGKSTPIEVKIASIATVAYINKIGKQDLLLIQFVDISSQKLLEQQFMQSQKMQAVGQLAGGIAHDFNNLLTAMIGFCDLLLQRYVPNDPSYGDVVQIKQNAKRAANLVRQLLAFSSKQVMIPKVISIVEVLSDLSTLLKRLIGSNIEFTVIHDKNIWSIKVDCVQFEQVIINLCVNARDAMQPGGRLTIRTKNFYSDKPFKCVHKAARPGDYVLIEVTDTGSGIDPNIIENIFEPFFSGKKKDDKSFSGTGLGLSTVYGIINQVNGFIRVQTELGKGSSIQVFIPRYVGPMNRAAEKERIVRDLSGSDAILLVEDEDSVRMFSARALRDKGYKVMEACSGEEALEIAKSEKFDLLITDVVMSRMDGPTLSKNLRETFKNLKTIFMSGYTEDTFRQNVGKYSNIHFIQKPFTLKDLVNKVKDVILNG